VIVLPSRSDDAARPFANLLLIVDALVSRGNQFADGGFVLNPDGWRCRLTKPLDFEVITELFELPDNVQLSRETDTVLDRATWCSIEGPGAHG
jgi:hypothetical protein